VGILVTFVPPKVTARRGMSDMPARGTAADKAHSANAKTQRQHLTKHDCQILKLQKSRQKKGA